MAAARLAHFRALRHRGLHLAHGIQVRRARRLHPEAADLGRDRLRRHDLAAERRHHRDQRQPCRAADGRRAGPGRGSRSAVPPHGGAAGGLGRVRGVGRRGRPDHRRSRGRGDGARRWPGAGVGADVRRVHRGAGAAAARAGPGRGDRRAVPGRRRRGAARRRGHRRRSGRAGPRCRAGDRRSGGRRHPAAVHAVRLRAEPGFRHDGRCVPQPRAAGGRGGRHRALWRPVWPGATGRRHRGPGRDRAEQPPGGRPATSGAATRRARTRRASTRRAAASGAGSGRDGGS